MSEWDPFLIKSTNPILTRLHLLVPLIMSEFCWVVGRSHGLDRVTDHVLVGLVAVVTLLLLIVRHLAAVAHY